MSTPNSNRKRRMNDTEGSERNQRVKTEPPAQVAEGNASISSNETVEVPQNKKYGDTLSIIAGLGDADCPHQRFIIHKSLIREAAPFLLDACEAGIDGTNSFLCPDLDGLGFEIFADWLYRKSAKLDISLVNDDYLSGLALDMYYFAQKFQITALMNLATTILHESFSDAVHQRSPCDPFLSNSEIQEVYDWTTVDSKLRELFVDFHAQTLRARKQPINKELPKEFLGDVIERLRVTRHPFECDAICYHSKPSKERLRKNGCRCSDMMMRNRT